MDTTAEAPSITTEQKKRLLELGADLPQIWNDRQTPIELKKQILRTVIEEIVVNSAPGSAEHRLQVHWAGGVHTELIVPRNRSGHHGRCADGKVIELVGELIKVCDDKTIAGVLNRLGYRTGQGNHWSEGRVCAFRHTHGLTLSEKPEGWMTLEKAAQALGVSDKVVKTLIRKNILPAKQVVTFAPWVIEQKHIESAHVQAAARAAKRGGRIPSAIGGQAELTL